jgi:GntR family transcriptional regulator
MARDRRPLPVQVREGLQRYISEVRLKPGGQLPSEEDLASRFEVSRPTLREALRLMERDGLVEVRVGNGRFLSVLPVIERPITRLEGMTEFLQAQGYRVSDRVLSNVVRPATDEEAKALQLEPGADVIHLQRIRMQDEEPLTYSSVSIPRSLFPPSLDQFDWAQPLNYVLESLGLRPAASNAQIRAAMIAPSIAKASGLPRGPFILLVQTIVSDAGEFLLYAHDYYRGDHFAFSVRRNRA